VMLAIIYCYSFIRTKKTQFFLIRTHSLFT
jgi:hypothetical protein